RRVAAGARLGTRRCGGHPVAARHLRDPGGVPAGAARPGRVPYPGDGGAHRRRGGRVERGIVGTGRRGGAAAPGVTAPTMREENPIKWTRRGSVHGMAAVYTHGHHESVLRSHRWRTAENSAAYLVPYLTPGMSLLDVGCGPGTITADLAARVAPGRVTAVELTDGALDLARAEIASRRLANVDFAVSDVHALDFPDATFDVVHAHQVLQHVADPVAALRELRRVCAPGGIVAARDSDYAAFTWYPALPELDEWLSLYRTVARANGGEP